MGLASATTTALNGMRLNETSIDVLGNNVANAGTRGFKSSEALFTTQLLRTLSSGDGPTTSNGGTNPRQVGLGGAVSTIRKDFSQGSVTTSNSPTDMAIEGEGFFIVANGLGTQYTRDGSFTLNPEGKLVNPAGARVQGFGIDGNYNLQTAAPTDIEIPLGKLYIAEATNTARFGGGVLQRGRAGHERHGDANAAADGRPHRLADRRRHGSGQRPQRNHSAVPGRSDTAPHRRVRRAEGRPRPRAAVARRGRLEGRRPDESDGAGARHPERPGDRRRRLHQRAAGRGGHGDRGDPHHRQLRRGQRPADRAGGSAERRGGGAHAVSAAGRGERRIRRPRHHRLRQPRPGGEHPAHDGAGGAQFHPHRLPLVRRQHRRQRGPAWTSAPASWSSTASAISSPGWRASSPCSGTRRRRSRRSRSTWISRSCPASPARRRGATSSWRSRTAPPRARWWTSRSGRAAGSAGCSTTACSARWAGSSSPSSPTSTASSRAAAAPSGKGRTAARPASPPPAPSAPACCGPARSNCPTRTSARTSWTSSSPARTTAGTPGSSPAPQELTDELLRLGR